MNDITTVTTANISLIVNGQIRSVAADPMTPLSATLRDQLGLIGTKVGCEAGDCGACTVLIDGEQVCACLVSTAQAEGARVLTVEAEGDALLERLRRTFHSRGAAQCGICTPGMLMAARDLLGREATVDRWMVEDALGGVLCRCTGYLKIVDAVLAAAANDLVPDEAPAAGASVGAALPRTDGWPKVTGQDRFGADVAPDGALWLRVVRSPHARARFAIGDLAPLKARHSGLVAVLSAADLPAGNDFGVFPHLRDQSVLADGQVRHRGEAVLALVGDARTMAGLDDEEIPIEWAPEAAICGLDGDDGDHPPPVHAERPDNVLIRGHLETGDLDQGFAVARAVAEGSFETAFVEHAYIEPEAGYARRVGERIEVAACTQAPYLDRDEIAHILGIAPEQVRILPTACGGGFGGKIDLGLQPLLAVAAWRLDRPVRGVMSRTESMAASTKRHPAKMTAKLGADVDGRITAFRFHGDFNTGAYASWGPTVAGRVPVHAAGPYAVANVRNTTRALYTNEVPAGAFRGFGVPQAAIAQEALLDDVALQLGIDRLEIRHRNALRPGDRTHSGQLLKASCGLAACLDALRQDWQAMQAGALAWNAEPGPTRRGAGIGCMWYGCGNTALPNPSTIRITLDRKGRLTLYNGAVDIGQGSTTVILQICADALGLPVSAFDLVLGDTDLTADAGKTSASRQTFISGKAALLAGQDLRDKILALANVGEDATLRLDGKRLFIEEGGNARQIDMQDLPDSDGVVLEGLGTFDPPTSALDEKGQGNAYATYAFAAQIAEVEVDLELATVKVRRMVAAHDVGRAINPQLVEGQIHGGIAQGLGMALMEEFVPGRTENLHDYLIPTFGDMPEIEIKLIEDPEPLGPYGAKGIGEPALIPTPPAILGAIRHATGVQVRQVPVLPHRLAAALKQQRETAP